MVRDVNREYDLPLFTVPARKFLTVSELNELIKGTLESQLDAIWVQGEISNFRVPPSGHYYFTLKDDKNQISAVMFRRQGMGLRFMPENGMAVLCLGRVSLYSVRGDLQLYVDDMEAQGQGALFLAFEQLKKKLAAEGLFATERKKPLPFLPRSIGIVTSDRGAALHDLLRILGDRYPERRVVIRPVKVQGDGAAVEIAEGIADLNRFEEIDVMIVGRGGGSLEDLWAFNEEIVARAIGASKIPVVSAVGHEIDFTIADFAADARAPTPTAAAEMILPRKRDLLAQVEMLEDQLRRNMVLRLETARDHFRSLVKRLADPGRKLRENQQRLDELSVDLLRRCHERLRQSKDRLAEIAGRLNALSPLAVLERGYSIAHKLPEERIVKSAAALEVGDAIRVTFAQGKALCRVEGKE
jgi:exodeoxyribonuclease VII large subunit